MPRITWEEFLESLPQEFLEPSYCSCGCGADRMVKDCRKTARY